MAARKMSTRKRWKPQRRPVVRTNAYGPAYLLWLKLHDDPIPARWRGVGGFSTFVQDTGGLACEPEVLPGQTATYYENFMATRFGMTANDGTRQVFVVDDEDADLIRSRRWTITALERTYGTVYTIRALGWPRKFLHQLIMGDPPREGLVIDHKDRDKLNNRRSNLRWATRSQNKANSGKMLVDSASWTPYKGVYWDPVTWLYTSRIRSREPQVRRSRTFDTADEAARWYDEQALELFGEFACTNEMLGLIHTTATHLDSPAGMSRPTHSQSVRNSHV
ncbi:HNH endonuclease [Pseudonocardia sp. WMMC193]|uniref:HNH endonuclease n=1 Tax=Pseudonocardia sp. WMMC193 TaxID=2911965 RepID=UPI001F1A1420|nr:HNH endonuclease [Pseudonocardia sp. WMMC193]MCF7552215.1 HNH endonuclease [Pseudonocardia sp. WMMC193]